MIAPLYRIITNRTLGGGKKEVMNVTYSRGLNYSRTVTVVDPRSYPEYSLTINRPASVLDKDQKMIFENDIIEDSKGKKFLVKYNRISRRFVLFDGKHHFYDALPVINSFKVIGNVYQNKGLWMNKLA